MTHRRRTTSSPCCVVPFGSKKKAPVVSPCHSGLASVPVPRALYLEPDLEWLERPFFVMEEIEGCTAGSILAADPYGPHKRKIGEQFFTILWVELFLLWKQRLSIQAQHQTSSTLIHDPTELPLVLEHVIVRSRFLGDRRIHHQRVGPLTRLDKALANVTHALYIESGTTSGFPSFSCVIECQVHLTSNSRGVKRALSPLA